MNSIRKLVMMLGVLLASSVALVCCSDDDDYPNFGAIGINSLQSTSSTVTIYWTIVPSSKCAGYEITLNQGTREQKGAEVLKQTFDNKTANHKFEGLTPNTSYVFTTKAIPAQGSGFSGADTYEYQFMTAPLISGISLSFNDATATATWDTVTNGNCGGYTVVLQQKDGDEWKNVSSVNIAAPATGSQAFNDILPATTYRVGVAPRTSNSCFYPAGETNYSGEFTSPAL